MLDGIGGERIVTSRDSRSQTRAGATCCAVRYAKRISILSRNATPLYKYQPRRVVMSAMFNRPKERHDVTLSSIRHYASEIVRHMESLDSDLHEKMQLRFRNI